MKLYKLIVKNFRKLNDVEIVFSDSTFLIGANNAGKSSTLEAIEYLLSTKQTLDESCRSKYVDTATGEEKTNNDDVIIEGEFREVPFAIVNQHGFNPRRLKIYKDSNGNDCYAFNYRVRLGADNKTVREMQMHPCHKKPQFDSCTKWQDFIDAGADAALFSNKGIDLTKKLLKADQDGLEDNYPELFDIDESDIKWVPNPGGIPGNVLSQLPRFLKIEASVADEEISNSKSGALHELLSFLFEDVRASSPHYQEALVALEELQKEMNPEDPQSDFGNLMSELNVVVDSVFPSSSIDVKADLTKPDTLKPIFDISMRSNVTTPVSKQGTGMIRSAVFALLRFKQEWEEKRNQKSRGLIVGFEEPELFLHPNAAENMRNIIYELSNASCQIIATTHSPYMINLSKTNSLILNSYSVGDRQYAKINPFNVSEEFKKLTDDEKTHVKMIQKIDEYVARVFFTERTLIVEGDTEDVVFRQTISAMPKDVGKQITAHWQIIKARGKAVMISFVKYLRSMGIDVFVVHDEDANTPGAVKMNDPILQSLGNDPSKRYMMHNCIEDELRITMSHFDKPYNAYKLVKDWKNWNDVPQHWKDIMKTIFSEYSAQL